MRYVYLVVDIAIAIGLLSLAFTSLSKKGYKESLNRIFAGFGLFVALWIISNNISNDVNLPSEVALFSDYIVFSSSFGSLILLTQFVAKLSGSNRLNSLVFKSTIPLWILCLVSATPAVTADVVLQGEVYAVVFGPLIWLYAIGMFYMIAQLSYGIYHGLRYSKGLRKSQMKSISFGLAIALPLILVFSFIIPYFTGDFSVTEFGISPAMILVICLYYGVVKYRLFDIRLAAVRTMAYVLSLITLSLVYYYLAFLISLLFFHGTVNSSVSVNPLNIVLALLLAFIFQPIKKSFDKMTNAVFYKDNYNSDNFFASVNRVATMTNDINELLRGSAKIIASTIKIDQVFFIAQKKDDGLIMLGTNHHSRLPHADVIELDRYVEEKWAGDDGYLLSNNESDSIRRMMVSHKIELIIPLILSNEIVGYLCLGDKKSGSFNSRDINVLKTASDELTIAIQNALAVQEIREFNETLKQRVANATRELRASNAQLQRLDKAKDEFVSMASHQLRTPLTTVKGYISMVMDGDAGDITNEQRNLLNEAFLSSERMVGLINDFLNVSRIQTGKFVIDKHPTDLSQLVNQEIDRLRASASSRNMEFVFEKPDDFPMINIDEGKIREVVMNFSDNAIYYSHEGSKIKVTLAIEGDNVIFKVKDTGIGVPIEEQAHLFSKFYRASNAKRQRPDGTGVGLFLAKKVITAHNGKVLFETVQDEGSTFGFSLPIEQSEQL